MQLAKARRLQSAPSKHVGGKLSERNKNGTKNMKKQNIGGLGKLGNADGIAKKM